MFAMIMSVSTILIVAEFVTGELIVVPSKCCPSTCLNPHAFIRPCSVPLLFFFITQTLSIIFVPAYNLLRNTTLNTLFVTIH